MASSGEQAEQIGTVQTRTVYAFSHGGGCDAIDMQCILSNNVGVQGCETRGGGGEGGAETAIVASEMNLR